MHDLHTLIGIRKDSLTESLAQGNIALPEAVLDHAARLWVAVAYIVPEFDKAGDEDTALEMLAAFCDGQGYSEATVVRTRLLAMAAVLYAAYPSRAFDAWCGQVAQIST